LKYIGIIRKSIQTFLNIGLMQRPTDRMTHIIKQFRHINAFISRIRRRLRKTRIIDIVGRPPGEIGPMGPGFQQVVLKIIVMHQYKSFLIA